MTSIFPNDAPFLVQSLTDRPVQLQRRQIQWPKHEIIKYAAFLRFSVLNKLKEG